MSASTENCEDVLWMISNSSGESFLNETGVILLFQNLDKALFFIRYETDDPNAWQVNEVAVDEDLFKNCEEYGNII